MVQITVALNNAYTIMYTYLNKDLPLYFGGIGND
jgi:hypothetical protein